MGQKPNGLCIKNQDRIHSCIFPWVCFCTVRLLGNSILTCATDLWVTGGRVSSKYPQTQINHYRPTLSQAAMV
eukprot:4979915-Amphidinium_carterae.1